VLNFIMHKYFSTNFMVLKRTQDLRATGLRIELHKVFLYKTTVKKCSSDSKKGSLVSASITLLMEVFINFWE
jgi:hypothetical protein